MPLPISLIIVLAHSFIYILLCIYYKFSRHKSILIFTLWLFAGHKNKVTTKILRVKICELIADLRAWTVMII